MNSRAKSGFEQVEAYAKKVRKNLLDFNSESIECADSKYVGWIDLMGAGHVMSVSTQKAANYLARLHMAVERSRRASDFRDRLLVVNDGVFIVTDTKQSLTSLMGRVFIMLAANFIATPRPEDRFLVRGGIAFGPVYFGEQIKAGVSPRKFREGAEFLKTVMFGPSIIQAYKAESAAPPYGVAVHESARSSKGGSGLPFLMTHWPWWLPEERNDYPENTAPPRTIKECLADKLSKHFEWMGRTLIYHGIEHSKLTQWSTLCSQYFAIG